MGNGGGSWSRTTTPARLILDDLKRQLRLKGTLKEQAAQLGVNHRYLYDVLSGKNPLTLAFYLKMVKTFDLSLPASIKTLEHQYFDKPVEILGERSARRRTCRPAAFPAGWRIGSTCCWLARSIARSPGPSGAFAVGGSGRAAFRRPLDGAGSGAASGVRSCSTGGRCRERPEARGAPFGRDWPLTVALWSTIQRTAGFRDLAIKGLALAFPLARHSGDHWALGCWYQRAAYLLRDFDQPGLGTELHQRGHRIFCMGPTSQLDIWKCLLWTGAVCLPLRATSGGQLRLRRGFLRNLPGSEWRYRVGALQGLGVNFQLQGLPEKARSLLVASGQLNAGRKMVFLGHIKWAIARVETDLAQANAALRHFHEATELHCPLRKRSRCGSGLPGPCGDSCGSLIATKPLAQLVAGVARWLPKLRANPILCRAFDKFADLARAARIGLRDFEKMRNAVREAWKLGELVLPG